MSVNANVGALMTAIRQSHGRGRRPQQTYYYLQL